MPPTQSRAHARAAATAALPKAASFPVCCRQTSWAIGNDPPSVRAYAPTRSSKPHLRAPPPGPRLKPGPVFVASGGVISAKKARRVYDGSHKVMGVLNEKRRGADALRARSSAFSGPTRRAEIKSDSRPIGTLGFGLLMVQYSNCIR